MGWKDLFKAKPVKLEPDPRLRWFGKLPTYADYYQSATDADWAVEFNEWLLKGCEQYITRQRERGVETRVPSCACVVRLTKTPMTVMASIQDYGGDMRGRPFPLAFYVGVPTESWPGPLADTVLPALRALQELTRLREEVLRFFNAPGRFEDVFRERTIALDGLCDATEDGSWRMRARALPLTDWFAAVQPTLKAEDPARFSSAADGWGRVIADEERGSTSFTPTLRFPIGMHLPFEVQVPGWLCWLGARMNLSERALSLLLAKDSNGRTGRLTVVARELRSEDFLLMTGLADSLTYADDLSTVDGEAAAGASTAAPVDWLQFVDSGGV